MKQDIDFEFRVDTAALLKEIAEHGLQNGQGILKIPINIFQSLLARVADRAIQINDPELNILMLKLALYEGTPKELVKAIKQQRKLIKKK